MKTLLLGIAIETDTSQASSTSYYTNDYHDNTDSFYVDRNYKKGHSGSTRRVPEYGARYNTGVNPSANRNKPVFYSRYWLDAEAQFSQVLSGYDEERKKNSP